MHFKLFIYKFECAPSKLQTQNYGIYTFYTVYCINMTQH